MSTILVVDDMAIFREPIAMALRTKGYQTLCAADGNEALTLLKKQTPDLILLDLSMPVMDGLTCLGQLRQFARTAAVPVIILTAMAERNLVVQAAKLGIAGYMLKSTFSLAEMLHKVREVLDQAASKGPAAGAKDPLSTPAAVTQSKGAHDAQAPGLSSVEGPGLSKVEGFKAGPPAPRSDAEPFRAGSHAAPPAMVSAPAPAVITPAASAAPVSSAGPVDVVEALHSLPSIMTRSQVLDRLDQCDQLKAFSPAVTQLMRLTNNPNCAMDDVVRAIGQDQAIALKILKLANSVVYTRGDAVDSIKKAVLRIGMNNIRQAVLNIGIVEKFDVETSSGRLDMGQFWEHSIGCGVIAAGLAHALGDVIESDSAFAMGLLHDVGRVILIEHFADEYQQVLAAARDRELPLEQVEARMLMLHHAELMESMLTAWKFSQHLAGPIVHHHLSADGIRQSAVRQLHEVAVLALANRLAHAFLLGSSGNEVVYPTHELVQLLDLPAAVIQSLDQTARHQTLDIKLSMLTAARQAQGWTQLHKTYMQNLPRDFSPLFLSHDPAGDSFHYFIKGLRQTGSEQPPNLAVVHLANVRERDMLTGQLVETEAKLGVGRLPTLIISPLARLTLTPAAMDRRRVELLPSPLPVSRLFPAVHRCLSSVTQSAA